MKKNWLVIAACAAAVGLTACSGGSGAGSANVAAKTEASTTQKATAVKPSPDKYTWYIKNYVGMNAGSIGYTSLAEDRRDTYGAGNIIVVFKTEDGSYVGAQDEEGLKDYVVVSQSLKPNTELKYTFQLDENGEEYENLVLDQNYDEIVLAVAKVGQNKGAAPKLTAIEASDRYTSYVKDYVGRNLASCGYISLAETLNDHYGHSYITFNITADDGSYIEVGEDSDLTPYKVVAQSVEPNTPITMTYSTDSDGKEYDSLVSSQSVESINLTVTKLSQE